MNTNIYHKCISFFSQISGKKCLHHKKWHIFLCKRCTRFATMQASENSNLIASFRKLFSPHKHAFVQLQICSNMLKLIVCWMQQRKVLGSTLKRLALKRLTIYLGCDFSLDANANTKINHIQQHFINFHPKIAAAIITRSEYET